MSLNETPSGERIHIGIFGKRNSGKSSLINAITGQNLAIVSEIAGTTTDPVYKAMELLPLGPVMLIDTPGLDDVGELGEKRIEKAYQALGKTDIAVICVDINDKNTKAEEDLIKLISEKNIPFVVVRTKSDTAGEIPEKKYENEITVSSLKKENIGELKNLLGTLIPEENKRKLVGDLINAGDTVILVVPIDKAAPKGRLILPQQQAIRDILDAGGYAFVTRDTEYKSLLDRLPEKPKLVICDSQVFSKINAETPKDIPLTSFSILMARYKGNLDIAVKGVRALEALQYGDNILISEGCTHHRQCGDIGSVKIPAWLEKHTGKKFNYTFSSGGEFTGTPERFKLIIHCGGCMLNEKEMQRRYKKADKAGIPVTNYGILISYLNGILERATEML